MRSTVIWPWKWRTKFWNVLTTPAFSFDADTFGFHVLSSRKIDRITWNECVEKSGALIFNRYEYLSALTQWDAIINADYSVIFPLPYRRKFGIKYYTTALFTHRLQLIGETNEQQRQLIIRIIRRKVLFATFFFTTTNIHPTISKTNYVISLDRSFQEIQRSVTFNFRSEVKHALKFNLKYAEGDVKEIMTLWKATYHIIGANSTSVRNFIQLCRIFLKRNDCICRCVEYNGKVLAAVILLKDNYRLYNMVNYVSDEGRKNSANYLLYNEIIREFAGRKLLFDFVGSELKGVKEFYKKFRPASETYHLYVFDEKIKTVRKLYLLLKRIFSTV